ncbi:MAG TPA: YraN family protein [Armatimonadota bacterium]|nr:YraN family protein [Armatimonadota bacterium]
MKWPWSRHLLTRNELGALGERHAARALHAKGMQVLEANYRRKQGEIDLIARDGDILVFVEVRTRTSSGHVSPLESVNPHKQAQIIRMAHLYIRNRRLPECHCRFDVVEVWATPTGTVTTVHHIPGAFIDD